MLSKAEQLKKLAGGYLDQAGQPSNPTLLNTPQNVPVSQLSFAAPGTQMATTPPQYNGGQTWVPGVGLLGADLGGAVKGDMLRQQYAMNAAQNNREEEAIGLAKTKTAQQQDYLQMAQAELGIKLNEAANAENTYMKGEQLENGMVMAAREGGFEGVIDFLKANNPMQALQAQAAKLQLDHGIMENETYKLAHANDKNVAMLQGYQMLGSMGATLLNTPPDQRAQAYKELLPIARQIDPNMPKELDSNAVSKFMLGMTLSTPANILYNKQKQAAAAQSTVGKLQADIESRIANGETAESSPALKSLLLESAATDAKATEAMNQAEAFKYTQQAQQLSAQKTQLDVQNAKQSLISSITNNYEKRSKPYADFLSSTNKIESALQVLQNDPTNPAAMQTLQYGFAKVLNGTGVLTDQDINRTAASDGQAAQAWKQIQSLGTGGKVVLTPNEISNMSKMYGVMKQSIEAKQLKTDMFYQNQLKTNGLPSNSLQFYKSAPPEALQQLMSDPSPQNMNYFKATFGYTPDITQLGE